MNVVAVLHVFMGGAPKRRFVIVYVCLLRKWRGALLLFCVVNCCSVNRL